MRGKVLVTVAVILLAFTVARATAPGVAEDAGDPRIDGLETRVAALETQVAAWPPASTSGQTGEDGQSSTSSSTSSTSSSEEGTSSYAASYSSSGARVIEFEINRSGDYHLTATTSSALTAVVETEDGEPVPGFEIAASGPATLSRTDRLEPGAYVLRVTSSSDWNITIVSISS